MLEKLKQTELHVHMGGCLTAQDLADIAADFYGDIDWQPYCDNYQKIFGQSADPIAWFDAAVLHDDIKPLEQGFVVTQKDAGDFARFQARFDLLIYVARALRERLGHQEPMLERIFTRHRSEGLRYVEYRAMSAVADTYEKFIAFHGEYANACLHASDQRMHTLPRARDQQVHTLPRASDQRAHMLTRARDQQAHTLPRARDQPVHTVDTHKGK